VNTVTTTKRSGRKKPLKGQGRGTSGLSAHEAIRGREAPAHPSATATPTITAPAGSADADLDPLRDALFRRVESYLRETFAHMDRPALLDAVEAITPAETVARAISTAPEVGVGRDDWSEALLRGASAKQSALATAGGALSSGEVAELLGITVAAVKQRQRRGGLLAIPLANGEWGYPARQFAPGGRVREGLKEVLAAFAKDEDPWVILSFLANPDPASGNGIAFDALDDLKSTRALVEVARTFWEQGAA
jgi:DNA-directed RNA polymerase specialized sigma24 family protein